MNTQEIVALVLALLQEFFANNPTVEEIEALLPVLLTAFANAKAGKAFELPVIPVSIDGVKGQFKGSWAPVA